VVGLALGRLLELALTSDRKGFLLHRDFNVLGHKAGQVGSDQNRILALENVDCGQPGSARWALFRGPSQSTSQHLVEQALYALLIVLAEMLLIRAVENQDRMRMVGLGAFLVCGGLAILPFGPGWMTAVVFMIVLTVGEMLSMPIANAVVAERAGTESVGRYMGVYTLTFSTAFVIGPITGTAIYQNLGPQVLWLSIGAVGIVLAVAFAALSRPLRGQR
jgi:MFS family permease